MLLAEAKVEVVPSVIVNIQPVDPTVILTPLELVEIVEIVIDEVGPRLAIIRAESARLVTGGVFNGAAIPAVSAHALVQTLLEGVGLDLSLMSPVQALPSVALEGGIVDDGVYNEQQCHDVNSPASFYDLVS